MTEKNKRKDVIILSRGTWDAMTKELERRESPLLPEFIKSARRRNPHYSLEWTEANAAKLLANRKAKTAYRKAQAHLSNGGTLWLRVTQPHDVNVTFNHRNNEDVKLQPSEVVYSCVSLGPRTTRDGEVFVYVPSLRGRVNLITYTHSPLKESVLVNPEDLVFELPELPVRCVELFAEDLTWIKVWQGGYINRLINQRKKKEG